MIRPSVRRAARVEIEPFDYTQTRVIPISAATFEQNKVVASGADKGPAATAFKILRTQVLRRMQSAGWRTLAVVSPAPDDGKTLVSVNLAMSMARDVHTTALLVDLDLHRPSVHRYFGLTPDIGVNDVLAGNADVSDAMFNPGVERLTVLPASAPLPDPSEVLASDRTRRMVDELRNRYASRVVVFDLPPVLATDDALAFMPGVDCVLLVVTDAKHTPEELQRTAELIAPAPLVGAVLNRSDMRGQPYYYGVYA